jgi:hypothetical protein
MRDSRNTNSIFFLSMVTSRSSPEAPWCRSVQCISYDRIAPHPQLLGIPDNRKIFDGFIGVLPPWNDTHSRNEL